MNTYVIFRRGGWTAPQDLEKAAGVSARVAQQEMADRVRWIRTYIVHEPDGRLGTVCVYQGTDPAAVREHARRAGLPVDEVVPLVDTVVINDDPPRAA